MRTTALSIVIRIGNRLFPVTMFEDGSFRSVDGGSVLYGVDGGSAAMSQRKMVNGLKHAGTANFRSGSFAVSTIRRETDTTIRDGIIGDAPFTVIRDLPLKARKALYAKVVAFYELPS